MPEREQAPEAGTARAGGAPAPPVGSRRRELLGLLLVFTVLGAVVGVGVALALGVGYGLDALAVWAKGPCPGAASSGAGKGTVFRLLGHLRSAALVLSGIGVVTTAMILCFAAMNERMHHAVKFHLKLNVIFLGASATAGPLAAIIGCAAWQT